MPRAMSVTEVGNVYELRRDQWRGNVARISKDPELLNEVCKYTWTYSEGVFYSESGYIRILEG